MLNVRCLLLVAAGVSACDHSEPFRPGAYGPDGPRTSGPLVQLTYNVGEDIGPAWRPDGAIVYSAERQDRADRDRCLALQPAGGGAVSVYSCRTTAANDSLDVFEGAAFGPDGRVAYARAASHRFPIPIGPDAQALVVGTLEDPSGARVLRPLPHSVSDGPYEAVASIAWLGSTRLMFLAQRVRYPRPCSSCAPDTVRTGLRLVTIEFSGSVPVLAELAGTDSVSSAAVSASPDTIYFTRNGDSRVYRYALSSGDTATVHDFGASGIARDVSVAAGRLAAVVGGDVFFVADPILGPSQVDNGGPLRFVILATGAESVLGADTSRFRRPALSPDGTRVVYEDWTAGRSNVWLADVP